MSVTVESFRLAFPEFRETEAALIDQKILAASLRTAASSWGTMYDQAVMYLTAHLLAVAPEGELVRLKKENRVTTYELTLERMRREATIGLGRIT